MVEHSVSGHLASDGGRWNEAGSARVYDCSAVGRNGTGRRSVCRDD